MFRKKSSSSASLDCRTLRRPGQALRAAAATADVVDGHSTACVASSVQSQRAEEKEQSASELSEDERDGDAAADGDDAVAAIHRPLKRRRTAAAVELKTDSKARTASDAAVAGTVSSSSLPLVTVASSRSALPDRSSASHQHTRFAPKNPEQPQQQQEAAAGSGSSSVGSGLSAAPAPSLLSLPSRSAPAVSRFGPLRSSGYSRSISRFDYQPDVCVAAGTPVTLADGSSKAIETVTAGESVLSFDRSRNGLVPMAVSGTRCSGMQECIELLFSDGSVLVVTADHRILTDAQQWRRAGDLVVGQSHVSVGMPYPLQSAEELLVSPAQPATSSASAAQHALAIMRAANPSGWRKGAIGVVAAVQQAKQEEEEALPLHPLVAGWLPHQQDQLRRPFNTGALPLSEACTELRIGQFFSLDNGKRKAEEEVLEDEPPAKIPSLFSPSSSSSSSSSSPSSSSPSCSSAQQPAGRCKIVYGVPVGADALPMFRAKLVAAHEVGQRLVYDLSVPQLQQEDRSFVAAGVVVHNCKDWLECGSCGYGDSCKFLHDRLDYKQGWQLDREWEEQQRQREQQRSDDWERRSRGETVVRGLQDGQQEEGEEAEERRSRVGLPFACFLCRQPFTRPVMTACGHYFDERCALRRYVQSSACAVCGKETGGSFTVALDLMRHMEDEARPTAEPT